MSKFKSKAKTATKSTYTSISAGEYSARLVHVIGMGEQAVLNNFTKETKNQDMISYRFEVLDTTVTQTNGKGEKKELPACLSTECKIVAGFNKGKMFDLVSACNSSLEANPESYDEVFQLIDSVVALRVETYKNRDGKDVAFIKGISAIPEKYKKGESASTVETLTFDPYSESKENAVSYARLIQFQRDKISSAVDSADIILAGTTPISIEDSSQRKENEKVFKKASVESEVEKEDKAEMKDIAEDDSPF